MHSSEAYSATNTLQEMRIDFQRMIDKVLKQSRAIDREGLCIVQGRIAWRVEIDILCINEDGNIGDACFLAGVLAIMNTRVPEI